MRPKTTLVFAVAAFLAMVGFSGASIALAASGRDFVNFESPQTHPLEMTPDGARLLVANTADNRIEVFSLAGASPLWIGAIGVGLEPISVRCRTATEVWVVNRLSNTVSVLDLSTQNVVATLAPGKRPADVVFAGGRAFVSVELPAQLSVFNPANRATLPIVVPLHGQHPRALATDGTRVFVAFFDGGNGTTILPEAKVSSPLSPYSGVNPPPNSGGVPGTFSPALAPGLPALPRSSLILNREGGKWKDANQVVWDPSLATQGLAQSNIGMVNASTFSATYVTTVCNITAAIGVQPSNGRVTAIGAHLVNYGRFETGARAQFARQSVVLFDPAAPAPALRDLNPHLLANGVAGAYITSATPAQIALSVAEPRSLVWKPDSSAVYIAGEGSNNIAKIAPPTGSVVSRLATIAVGKGPAGLAYDAARSRIYCLNRFDATISVISTASDSVIATIAYFDPTPPAIRLGRPLLYDGHLTSRLGQASCVSCHVDARTDSQPWDLGDPSGSMKSFDQECVGLTALPGTCTDFHPVKGPMMTQTLFGSVTGGPAHWRGDRGDITQFSVGYTGLLGRSTPPTQLEMAQLGAYLSTLTFEPNPYRQADDSLPASVPGFSGDPSSGQALFRMTGLFGSNASCVQCHATYSGSNSVIIPSDVVQESQGFKVPQLRDLYMKQGFAYGSTSNVRCAGFTHDGSADTVFNYLKQSKFTFAPGASGDSQRQDLEAFVMCWPTEMSATVGQQITVDASNKNDPAALATLGVFVQAAAGSTVGLVARGVVAGIPRGYAFDAATGLMQSDRAAQVVSVSTLIAGAASGAEITFTVVPAGTQVRAAIDRDSDGVLDQDELDVGKDPRDSTSTPVTVCASIDTSPASIRRNKGDVASFRVVASGTGPLTYQWRRNGLPLSDGPAGGGSFVTGANGPMLSIVAAGQGDVALYDCAVTNACGGAATSLAAALSIESHCAGDFNSDSFVDDADFVTFASDYDALVCPPVPASCASDLNFDGQVDDADFVLFAAAYNALLCP